MYLSRVSVKNFRNLRDITVDLSPGLNVLVGENNAGKTNILESLRLALGSQLSGYEKLSREDFFRSDDGKITSDPIRIDLVFSGLNENEQAEFIEIINYNASEPSASTASIHYQCIWNSETEKLLTKRWGGARDKTESTVPEEVLQSIQSTFLTAIRDAVVSLAPGRNNRLGKLLSAFAKDEDKGKILEIFSQANSELSAVQVVSDVEAQLNIALDGATGSKMKQNVLVRASEPDFEQIVRGLKVVLKLSGAGGEINIHELRQNGLGYNNLLFLATVLAELETTKESTLPIFLVEEPEAHLHPQLQTVLIDFLEKGLNKNKLRQVQTIVTSHSPSIASYVSFDSIRVIHKSQADGVKCFALKSSGLDPNETQSIKRMLDATRSALLFSKGVIFVEGISELLLVPLLGKRLNVILDQHHISVIPMCGVAFETITKIFGLKKLNIPVAVITDGDPKVQAKPSWRDEVPDGFANDSYPPCDRVKKLKASLVEPLVKAFVAKVTLEYDLALANEKNSLVMAKTWESLFEGTSSVLKESDITSATTAKEKALAIWRGICRSNTTKGKADFSHKLVDDLSKINASGTLILGNDEFVVPDYIKEAIIHVTK